MGFPITGELGKQFDLRTLPTMTGGGISGVQVYCGLKDLQKHKIESDAYKSTETSSQILSYAMKILDTEDSELVNRNLFRMSLVHSNCTEKCWYTTVLGWHCDDLVIV